MIDLSVVSDWTFKLTSVKLSIGVQAHNVDKPLLVLSPDQYVNVFAFLGTHHPPSAIDALSIVFLLFNDDLPSTDSYKALTN